MHVLLYHDAVIPPRKYGGTERIVYWLAQALVSLGHRVTLIACPGSAVEGAEVIAREPGKTPEPRDWRQRIPPGVDIVHLWGPPGDPPPMPFVVTIQGNGKPGERSHPNTLFISQKHAETHGSRNFVYNGIDPDDYPMDERREP